MTKTYKIFICGGHLPPALSVIEQLQKATEIKIYYIGRKYSMEGDQAESLEYQVIRKLDISFIALNTGRFSRILGKKSLLSVFKIPSGLLQSYNIFQKIKPDLVLGFGGYVSLPICLIAKLLSIPVIIHEQTTILGLANRLISPIAKKILLSFAHTKFADKYQRKTIVTGNPLRQSIRELYKDGFDLSFGDTKRPLIYITGGSQGSHQINKVISEIVAQLTEEYRIIHQCGDAREFNDYAMLSECKQSLSLKNRNNYLIFKKIDIKSIGYILSNANLIISRSGANTICEIAYYQIPSLLIPLEWSADKEQLHNADLLRATKSAIVMNADELTPEKVIANIKYIFKNIGEFKNNALKNINLLKINAAEKVTEIIINELHNRFIVQ